MSAPTRSARPCSRTRPTVPLTDFAPVALIADLSLVLVARKDLPAGNSAGVHRPCEGQPGQDAVRLGGRGLGDASRLRAAQCGDRNRRDAHSLSRRRAGDAGSDRRPDRLPLHRHADRDPADREPGRSRRSRSSRAAARRACRRSPSAHEQGLANFEASNWSAFFLPKGTPAPIVAKLNDATVAAASTPAVQQRLKDNGIDVVAPDRRSPDYLARFVESEIAKWAGPVKAAGVDVGLIAMSELEDKERRY